MVLQMPHRSGVLALIIISMMPAIQACESLSALSFIPAESSGIKEPQIVRLFYLRGTNGEKQFKLVGKGEIYNGLSNALGSCQTSLKAGPAAILLAAGGTVLIGLLTDALAAEVKRLRESGTRIYRGATLTDAKAYDEVYPECLLLVRYRDQPPEVSVMKDGHRQQKIPMDINDMGLAALFIEGTVGGGKAWHLIFLMMTNSLAVTAPGDPTKSDDPAKVDLSLALASKVVVNDKEKKGLVELPFDTMTIKGVPIDGKTPAVNCPPPKGQQEVDCAYNTTLFVVPAERQRTEGGSWFSIGVTETGSVAASFDDAAAELAALKAALGPAIGEAIKAWLTPAESLRGRYSRAGQRDAELAGKARHRRAQRQRLSDEGPAG